MSTAWRAALSLAESQSKSAKVELRFVSIFVEAINHGARISQWDPAAGAG